MNSTPNAEDIVAMNAMFSELVEVVKPYAPKISRQEFHVVPVMHLAVMMAASAGEWPAGCVGECLKDFAAVLQAYQQRASKAKATNN